MINLAEIRTVILTGLRGRLQKQWPAAAVVMAEPGRPEPEKPFVTMNFASPYIPERGLPSETYTTAGADIEITQKRHVTTVCSFNIYAQGYDLSREIGLEAQAWFEFFGYEHLNMPGIVVAEVMPLQNRDVYLVDSYDRRVGFDVRFRVGSELVRELTTIATVDLEMQEIE